MGWFTLWVSSMLLAGWVASDKGRSVFGWMLLTAIFSPLALLILLFLPSLAPAPSATGTTLYVEVTRAKPETPMRPLAPPLPSPADRTRECPFCAETIKAAAKLCRFCQREVEPIPASAEPIGPGSTAWARQDETLAAIAARLGHTNHFGLLSAREKDEIVAALAAVGMTASADGDSYRIEHGTGDGAMSFAFSDRELVQRIREWRGSAACAPPRRSL